MGKLLKQGKVVVLLQGRYAGKKAVIVKSFEDGSSSRKFQHVLVAGISNGPRKITKKMSKKNIKKRSSMRPFLKMVNYNHVMPTRYQVDLDLKKVEMEKTRAKKGEKPTGTYVVNVDEDALADPGKKTTATKAVKKVFQEGYFAQDKRKNAKATEGVKFLYQKLRF